MKKGLITNVDIIDDLVYGFYKEFDTKFLKEKPEASIVISPTTYSEKEKEHILFFETKKRYYMAVNKNQKTFTADDSLAVDRINIKDPSLMKFLSAQVTDTSLVTVQERCYRLVGADLVNKEFDKMVKSRSKSVMELFKKEGTNKQVKITSNTDEIPYRGSSYFKVSYKGEFPETLLEANQQLNQFDDHSPRAKYRKFRPKKILKGVFN